MKNNQFKAAQLRQYQAMPLSAKIRLSEVRIREAMEATDWGMYLSISGKDSCTMADIVWNLFPHVPAVYADTGAELKSVKANIQRMIEAGRPITIVEPKMTFQESVEKYGYPVSTKENAQRIWEARNTKSETLRNIRLNGYAPERGYMKGSGKIAEKWKFLLEAPFKVSSKCCKFLKCEPCSVYEKETGRLPFVGTLAEESRLRYQSYLKYGCNAFESKNSKASRPLIFWTEQDILEYIKTHRVMIPDVYGEIIKCGESYRTTGEERTGCVSCLIGADKDEVNRIQKLAVIEPETYRHLIEDLKYDEVMDFMGLEWRPVDEVKKEGLVR